jgi:lysine-N-methylase
MGLMWKEGRASNLRRERLLTQVSAQRTDANLGHRPLQERNAECGVPQATSCQQSTTFVRHTRSAWQAACSLNSDMLEHLRPQYAKRFRCPGSQCADNCCRHWEIMLDRATYERYERMPDLQAHLSEFFSVPEGASEERYAQIKLDPSGNCPFLSAERLCALQQHYGEAVLAPVCVTYPRNPHRIDGLMEAPLSLSCIEAARLVLLGPHLIPHQAETAEPCRYQKLRTMAEPDGGDHPREFRYFWEVREFCLLLITDRTYPLWQRLFLLGMFSKRLGEICRVREFGFVPRLLREYAEITATGSLRDAIESLPVRPAAQLQMVAQVAFGYLPQHKPELCRIHECVQEFLQGLGCESDSSLEGCTERYSEAYRRYYQPFMESHPFLLENYLVNHIFRVVFPFGQDAKQCFERPHQEYLMLCLEFAVMKGLLIGMAARHGEQFGVEHVVKLAQSLAKSLEHDRSLGGFLNWQGLAKPECVAALLKN